MDESSFKELKHELVKAAIIGTFQTKELIFQDQARPNLKVYIYKEPNHKRPHVHIYFGNEEEISICIKTQNALAGTMSHKYLTPIKQWVYKHQNELLLAWDEVQLGNKPELLWNQSESL